MRDVPFQSKGGIPLGERVECFCKKYVAPTDMLQIINTGLVKGVVSKVCRDCPNKAREEIRKLFAIVCVGCKEVVVYSEPYVEKTGFKWEAGKVYHVPCCPTCVGHTFHSSPVLEQKIFYKERGIPYKDDGVQKTANP